MKISKAGLEVIKRFEGLRLGTYIDAVGVPTIGYGHTGPDVQLGQMITSFHAEELLTGDISRFEAGVVRLIPVPLTQAEFDALVSFSFNVGLGALEGSTLRKRIMAGELPSKVIPEELPKWVKGNNGPLEGLVRRRAAEVKLVTEQATAQDVANDSYMVRAATFFKGLAHQKAAYANLERSMTKEQLDAFKAAYSAPQGAEKEPVRPPSLKFPLTVPYFYQRDSKTGHGERMCFSSSMAMALDYIDPSAIKGDDDWYLNQVLRFGDSVSSTAQLQAAHSLGFDAQFFTNGTQKRLEQLLDKGVPVPVGVLHKGSNAKPAGGGHWICLIGHNSDQFMVNDPFGEMDLVNGGYPKAGPTDGKNKLYSKKNLMKRWLVENDHSGWYMDLTQK